ncbi:electron transport protein [Camelliibacillus cellulosilyticus]|uniref:Electron transport protein n=1 Tax=Camelliibacillus cellulosilyticus TaxID=2174486 RepID=A0ABV9GND9_9BACL
MRKKRYWLGVVVAVLCVVFVLVVWRGTFEYAYTPRTGKVLNTQKKMIGYDQLGRFTTDDRLQNLSMETGTIKVDHRLLNLGKNAFYKETFGNEIFLTDIMGILNGPLTFPNIMKSIAALKGKGTSNLRVPLAKDITIDGHTFRKGEKINTGIDIPKGAYAPLGMPIHYDHGKIRVGISCAACHATVDRLSKNVVEGAPNKDLNLGLLMAMATNSSSYFTHTQIASIKNFVIDKSRTVTASDGQKVPLPDPKKLEKEVDRQLIHWPAGNFDSTIDMKANPSQIPDSFTKGDFPYGWSGFAQVGPFHGLSVFSNNVHAQNTDPLSQADISRALFGIDKEVYIGTILQNAASPRFRYHPHKDSDKPSRFFAKVDPTPGTPGVNELVKNPEYPKMTAAAPDGLIASSPGRKVNEENNAMAAWQNTIVPPKAKVKLEPTAVVEGRKVFVDAGCMTCHAGAYLTNNQIVPVQKVGTDPSRAAALKKTEKQFGVATQYAPDTPVPLPANPKVIKVPGAPLGKNQRNLGFAHGSSIGGYKTPSLNGLYWTAPYLHDGGVAVGPDVKKDLGIPGTLAKGTDIDPVNSLRAMVDRRLRAKVIEANRQADLNKLHVTGAGHAFWVDGRTGFTKKQQDALIQYLLSVVK